MIKRMLFCFNAVPGNLREFLRTFYILDFLIYSPTCLWRWNRQSVPKRRHIKFRRRGITQKKIYNIHFICLPQI